MTSTKDMLYHPSGAYLRRWNQSAMLFSVLSRWIRKVMPSFSLRIADPEWTLRLYDCFSQKSFKFSALSNINLVLGTGNACFSRTPNGWMANHIIKSILGLVVGQQGQILIDGQSIIHQHSHRAKLGYMPQIGRYPGNLTIGQLINMVRNLRPHQNHYDEELIDLLGIHAILSKKKMSALSAVPSKK